MVKTDDNQMETAREALIPGTENQTKEWEQFRIDPQGNFECKRCGWTHTTTECAEYRLVNAQRELEKVTKFVHMSIGTGLKGETPVDTFIRGYRRLYDSWKKDREAYGRGESTEITDLMKEE